MADVIRDVVVRITLEQINTALKVPDVTPLKAAFDDWKSSALAAVDKVNAALATVNTSTQTTGTTAVETADKTVEAHSKTKAAWDEAIKKAAEQALVYKESAAQAEADAAARKQIAADAAKQAADQAKSKGIVLAALKQERELIKDISDAGKQGAKDYQALLKQRSDAEKQVATLAEAAAAKQTQAQLKVLDVTKQLGEGTFQLARGIAFLTTSGDEDFREMLATIAKLQGGFDLIKGGATTIKALVEGTNALKLATGAATIGQAILAGANTAVATTAGIATAAVTALKVALGPIGLIITGIGAAAALTAAAWSAMSSKEQDLQAAMKKGNEELADRLKLTKELRDIKYQTSSEKVSLISGDNEGSLRELDRRGATRKTDRSDLDKQVAELEQAKQAFMEKYGRAGTFSSASGNALTASEGKLYQQISENQIAAATQRVALEEQAISDAKLYRDIQKDIDQIKSQELEKEKLIAEASKKGVDAALEKLAIEEKKLQSIEAQFGALTKQEQLEAMALSKKVKAGEELSRRELERLGQIGGAAGQEYVQQQYAKRGRASGADEFNANLGVDITAGVSEAGQALANATQKLAESRPIKEILEAQAQLQASSKEADDAMIFMINGLINDKKELLSRLKELEDTNNKNNALLE